MKCSIKKITLLMAIMGTAVLVEVASNQNILIQSAEARVGRPLTPKSVAGVARRTTRRVIRRSTVVVATLPSNCTTIVIEGTALQQCGGTYYQTSSGGYTVVHIN